MSSRRQALATCRLGWRAITHNQQQLVHSWQQTAAAAAAAPAIAASRQQARSLQSARTREAAWSSLVNFRGFAADSGQAAAAAAAAKGTGKKSPITFNSMLLGVGCFLAVVAVAQNKAQKKVEGMMQRSQEVVGKAAVGGPFTLTDQDGKPFTNEDLLGRFSVLYFGFTHCPDICPDELEKLAEALDTIEAEAKYQVRPVFISVDPQRDTPKAVKAYVKEFHPRLIGLTGSEEAVKACSKAYRVYFHKTGDSETDYLVDHSIIMYLIDPAGEFVTFYGKNFTARQLADSIMQHIAKWGDSSAAAQEAAAAARLRTGTAGSQEGLAQR